MTISARQLASLYSSIYRESASRKKVTSTKNAAFPNATTQILVSVVQMWCIAKEITQG